MAITLPQRDQTSTRSGTKKLLIKSAAWSCGASLSRIDSFVVVMTSLIIGLLMGGMTWMMLSVEMRRISGLMTRSPVGLRLQSMMHGRSFRGRRGFKTTRRWGNGCIGVAGPCIAVHKHHTISAESDTAGRDEVKRKLVSYNYLTSIICIVSIIIIIIQQRLAAAYSAPSHSWPDCGPSTCSCQTALHRTVHRHP